MLRLFISGLWSATLCLAQQSISVANAAGVEGPVAPGSILNIQQLKPPAIIPSTDPSRVSVEVRPTGSMDSLDAPLVPAPFFSIWAQLPLATPLGPADVTLTIDGQSSAPARIMVTRTNFGLFTQAGNGLGAAVALNQDEAQAQVPNKLTNPVLPGQYVILSGTGLGAAATSEVTVELGGTDIVPTYAGPAPDSPGYDQISFQVPDSGTPDGCYVSVLVKVGGSVSNEATIAKAGQPGPCVHPFGLSAADLATLDAGGQILFGAVHLQSDVGVIPGFGVSGGPSRFETASAQFFPRSAFEIGLLAQPLVADDSYFGCHATRSGGLTLGGLFGGSLDAGDSLTLTGPGQTVTLSSDGPLYFTSGNPFGTPLSDPPFFSPGSWHVEGPGGKTIGPFQADLVLPPLVQWTNRASLTNTIDRGENQDIAWDPTGYTDSDIATVTLSLTRLVALGSPNSQILCRTRAASGKLTIPSSLLETLPQGLGSLRLSIAPRPNRRVVFSLPLTDGSAAPAFFDYSFSDTISTLTR